MNTLVDMISGMEVKEDDEEFMNAVDYMLAGLEKRKPDCFAVKQYKKYKLASGVVCSKRLLNQAVGKSLRTHNLKPKNGAGRGHELVRPHSGHVRGPDRGRV